MGERAGGAEDHVAVALLHEVVAGGRRRAPHGLVLVAASVEVGGGRERRLRIVRSHGSKFALAGASTVPDQSKKFEMSE